MQLATTWVRRAIVLALVLALTAPLHTLNAAENYRGQWSRQADLATARYNHRSVPLADGRVLILGGHRSAPNGVFEVLATAELVDPISGTTTPAAPMPTARTEFAAAALADGRVLVAGGRTLDSPITKAELYNPAANAWAPTAPVPFGNATMAAQLGDRDVLVLGGWEAQAAASFDAATQSWSPVSIPSTLTANNNSVRSLTALTDGTVLALTSEGPTATYSPFTKSWTAGPNLERRQDTIVVRRLDGRVIVAGGRHGTTYRTSTWVYDPVARTFAAGPPLAHPHVGGVGALLPDGSILVAGGYKPDTGYVNSAELLALDAPNTWQSAGTMTNARFRAQATPVANGSVVVSGGTDGQFATKTVDVFIDGDKSPPHIIGATDRRPDVNGWYVKPVTVTFKCTDGESGVASCSGPTTLGQEGRGQSVTGMAVDRAGNADSTTVGPIGIDLTAPTTAIDTVAAAVVIRPNAMTGTATDTVSGVLAVRATFRSRQNSSVVREVIVSPTQCTPGDLSCRWSIPVPTDMDPGPYDVFVQAIDHASRIDPFGAAAPLLIVV